MTLDRPARSSYRLKFAWNLDWGRAILLPAAACLLVAAIARPASAEAPRTNVILIMADDFGYECVGANGGTSYKTPHLDRLAAEGARFEHCYAQPLCTPTRVQLMTGIYNVRNYDHFGVLVKKETTFGHLFRKSGYKTCIAGKWQLGRDFALPAHFGFDEYCLWQLTRRPERYKNPGLEINGKEVDFTQGEYGPDIVNSYALDFITRSKDEPFFLYYPMILTHSPFPPTPDSPGYTKAGPAESGGKKKGKKGAGGGNHFGDMVQYMDKLVGKLVARVDELGLRERTLIVFVGDNGTGRGNVAMMGERKVVGGKGTPDESGMRVPLIANMPGKVKAGQVRSDLVDSTDFLPTICAAAGIDVPSELRIDGHSFWPQLRGEAGTPRKWIYCWYNPDGGQQAKAEFAKNHEYKLYRDGRLFDVREGDFDKKPVSDAELTAEAKAAKQALQAALDRYADARPKHFVKNTSRGAD